MAGHRQDDLRAKLPEMDALMERTVDRIMVAPSRRTLEEIGPTGARPISSLIRFLRRTLEEFGPTGAEESD